MGLETVFSLLPISQGFLGSIYYSERFESVVLVGRLLSKFLAFLAGKPGPKKTPLKLSRPFNLPVVLLWLCQASGGDLGQCAYGHFSQCLWKSKWMCWFFICFLFSSWHSCSLLAIMMGIQLVFKRFVKTWTCSASTFAWAALTLWASQNYTISKQPPLEEAS